MKNTPKKTYSSYQNTDGGYGWDLGAVCFSDITEVSGSRVERLAKAAANGRAKYKKKDGDKTKMNQKFGPV